MIGGVIATIGAAMGPETRDVDFQWAIWLRTGH